MAWLLVLTLMVGKVGADDVVSFEDGFASNRRLNQFNPYKNELEATKTHNELPITDDVKMKEFCDDFTEHLNGPSAYAWRKGGTKGAQFTTGSVNAYGLAENTLGYDPSDRTLPFAAAYYSTESTGGDADANELNTATDGPGKTAYGFQHTKIAHVADTTSRTSRTEQLTSHDNKPDPADGRRLDDRDTRLSQEGPYMNDAGDIAGIADKCKQFLEQLESSSRQALSSVRAWLDQTQTIRDIARRNCVAGQKRQSHHQQKRSTAIEEVGKASKQVTDYITDYLVPAQNAWCAARNEEVLELNKEYGIMIEKINTDIDSPTFNFTAKAWTYSATNGAGVAYGFENIDDQFAINAGPNENVFRKSRPTSHVVSNSVADSAAASHLVQRKSDLENARSDIDESTQTLDTFYVDPTLRSWNTLCDRLKQCKTASSPTDVAVARPASLKVMVDSTLKTDVITGAVNNIADWDQCTELPASSTGSCVDGFLEGGSTPTYIFTNKACSDIAGALNEGQGGVGDTLVRNAVENAVCGDDYLGNGSPQNRYEKIIKNCHTYSDSTIRTKRLQFAKLEATAEHVISASAQNYLDYFSTAEGNMRAWRNAEYAALHTMNERQGTYVTKYLDHAVALRKAEEENQFFMEMVMEAEMMRLAYDSFQQTVLSAHTAVQNTYTSDQKSLFVAHMCTGELGAVTDDTKTGCPIPGLDTSGADTSAILQKTALYTITNKWFGIAQMNLEALLFDRTDVGKECCGNSFTEASDWGDSCPSPTCTGPQFQSYTNTFQLRQEDISGGKCVCTLLQEAYTQALIVRNERLAAIRLLQQFATKSLTVDDFCQHYTWACQ